MYACRAGHKIKGGDVGRKLRLIDVLTRAGRVAQTSKSGPELTRVWIPCRIIRLICDFDLRLLTRNNITREK
jgi:hypothetical protein